MGWEGGGELDSVAPSASERARVSLTVPVLPALPPTHQLKPWASRLTLGNLSGLIILLAECQPKTAMRGSFKQVCLVTLPH